MIPNTNTPDGGPAFTFTPTDKSGQIGPSDCGMTLRDYFAAVALTGIIASGRNMAWVDFGINAYRAADAMLAARGGGK